MSPELAELRKQAEAMRAETIRLREEIAQQRGRHWVPVYQSGEWVLPLRHYWLRHVIKDLETNPRTQYKVHLWGVIYWLVNFPVITVFFFLDPRDWLRYGVFVTLIYSIYANFATDYGSMSAAMAAGKGNGLPQIPAEPAAAPDGKPVSPT